MAFAIDIKGWPFHQIRVVYQGFRGLCVNGGTKSIFQDSVILVFNSIESRKNWAGSWGELQRVSCCEEDNTPVVIAAQNARTIGQVERLCLKHVVEFQFSSVSLPHALNRG